MCVTKKFSYEYVDYARRAGVELGDLWLEYWTKYLSPNDTPLKCKMHGNDVVLAYLKARFKLWPVHIEPIASDELLGLLLQEEHRIHEDVKFIEATANMICDKSGHSAPD
ncbi:uncharacterized protein LOC104883414 [Beta vulgaris subsp. vulgaris]|uniref:uncharacterized protein LOC104883414 n=1 Tax=Beta vulgaris subsp. vulgaris TaxID=3555 RepID=UPI002037364D|nr:uncharacterized protein LOC104883414 [Beta vulgaris subsp. vulgaris]